VTDCKAASIVSSQWKSLQHFATEFIIIVLSVEFSKRSDIIGIRPGILKELNVSGIKKKRQRKMVEEYVKGKVMEDEILLLEERGGNFIEVHTFCPPVLLVQIV
jgi:hypothetical protein